MNKQEQQIINTEKETLQQIEDVLKSEYPDRIKLIQIHSLLFSNSKVVESKAREGLFKKI